MMAKVVADSVCPNSLISVRVIFLDKRAAQNNLLMQNK